MSGNMESLLMGGDDSSSGESDDEVNVPMGTSTTAASAVSVAASAPVAPPPRMAPAPAPKPAPVGGPSRGSSSQSAQIARLKDLYNISKSNTSSSMAPAQGNSTAPIPSQAPRMQQSQRPPQQQQQQQPMHQQRQTHQSVPNPQQQQRAQLYQQSSQKAQQHPPQMSSRAQPTQRQPQQYSQPSSSQRQVYAKPSQQQRQQGQPMSHRQHPSQPIQQQRTQPIHGQTGQSRSGATSQQPSVSDPFAPTPLSQIKQTDRMTKHQQQSMQHSRQGTQPSSSRMHPMQASGSTSAPMTAQEIKRQKEKFLMFTRVLIKYLEQKDARMHSQAKQIIKDCAERNKRHEPGYESVTTSMRRRLKELVGDHYWKKANDYLIHFIEQKRRQHAQAVGGSGSSAAKQQQQQQMRQRQAPQAIQLQRQRQQAAAQQSQQRQSQTTSTAKPRTAAAPSIAEVQKGIKEKKEQLTKQGTAKTTKKKSTSKSSTLESKTTTTKGKTTKKVVRRKSTDSASSRKSSTSKAGASSTTTTTVVKRIIIEEPPREYKELMELIDHAVEYDWPAIGQLLGNKADLKLTDEERQLLYGDRPPESLITKKKASKPPVKSGSPSQEGGDEADEKEITLENGVRPGWGRTNVLSARAAWARIRLKELRQRRLEASNAAPVVAGGILKLPPPASPKKEEEEEEAEKTESSPIEIEKNNNEDTESPESTSPTPPKSSEPDGSWINEESAEQDKALALLSEACQMYLKGVLEKAIQCARQRQNLDGIRLWHQQYSHGKGASVTTLGVLSKDNKKSVEKSMKPPLSLRLGCDISRQLAQAHGNSALTVKRMEEALERQVGIPMEARALNVDTMSEATSMGDLSWRPLLKEGVKKADRQAKRAFEIYGGKESKDPPLGRVPKKVKIMVEDFVMGAELSLDGPYHKAFNASSSISF